ncbi:restriction endonuclease subunit S [Campylobacter sp. CNRCH_2014_2849]|nr:restriction endonuclease subunit S [Campylobacter sp. CNRCH_2014_2849]MCV3472845.1 restriction endonuclease subunit S [Campylobacter sp. CNRCH_2014_2849]
MSKTKIVDFKDLSRWDVGYFLGNHAIKTNFKLELLGKILFPRKEKITPNNYDGFTPIVAKIPFNSSTIEYRKEPKTKMDMYAVYKNDLLVSNINFHQGAIAIANKDKVYASTHYQPYIINDTMTMKEYLIIILQHKEFQNYVVTKKIKGIKTESNYKFIKDLQIPLPPLEIQKEIVTKLQTIKNKIKELQLEEEKNKKDIEAYVYIALGLKKPKETAKEKIFTVSFKNLSRWDITHNQGSDKIDLSKSNYPLIELKNILDYELPKKYIVSSTNYSDNFTTPVLTAGKTFILGYTDEDFGIFNNPPVIIFDDFTTAIQFVDFNFKVKSDALKILKIRDNTKINIKFLYEVLKIIKIDISKAHRRYYLSSYQYLKIPLPPIEIQNKIIEELEQKYEKIEENKQKAKKLEQDLYLEVEKIIIK